MSKRSPSQQALDAQNAYATDAALVEEALAEVFDRVSRITAAARAREIGARARAYRSTVRAWPACPPNDAQRDALVELVMALRDRARLETQTLPPPPESSRGTRCEPMAESKKKTSSVLGAMRTRRSKAPSEAK